MHKIDFGITSIPTPVTNVEFAKIVASFLTSEFLNTYKCSGFSYCSFNKWFSWGPGFVFGQTFSLDY